MYKIKIILLIYYLRINYENSFSYKVNDYWLLKWVEYDEKILIQIYIMLIHIYKMSLFKMLSSTFSVIISK